MTDNFLRLFRSALIVGGLLLIVIGGLRVGAQINGREETGGYGRKPVWTGKHCAGTDSSGHWLEGAASQCVTDTLNTLYPDRAVDAKVTHVGGYAGDFWVWYRQ